MPAYLPGTFHLDNAWLHRAASVRHLLCDRLGATLHYGLPAQPKMRALVESLFSYTVEHCTHRMPSTTGSHPKDPVREARKNRKRPPVVTFQALEDAVAVQLATYNATPQPGLGGQPPLDCLLQACQAHCLPWAAAPLRTPWQPFAASQVVTLHWHPATHRAPYINFQYARYHGPELLAVADREKRLRIQFDRRDLRTVQAYTLDGTPLGTLQVEARWRRFPHTQATRVRVHRFCKAARLRAQDPLAAYFHQLLARRAHPQDALALLQIHTEFTQGTRQPLCVPAETIPPAPCQPGRYTWASHHANHRR